MVNVLLLDEADAAAADDDLEQQDVCTVYVVMFSCIVVHPRVQTRPTQRDACVASDLPIPACQVGFRVETKSRPPSLPPAEYLILRIMFFCFPARSRRRQVGVIFAHVDEY